MASPIRLPARQIADLKVIAKVDREKVQQMVSRLRSLSSKASGSRSLATWRVFYFQLMIGMHWPVAESANRVKLRPS